MASRPGNSRHRYCRLLPSIRQKGTRDALFLSNYAKMNIVDTLKRVPGVGDATQWGG